MKALLVVAHGSRQAAANEEIRRLIGLIRRRASGRFDFVNCGFLQFAEPSAAEALEACVAQGATQVTILPYLLAAGSHVAQDIPTLVAARRKAHPEVILKVTPHIGLAGAMADVVLEHAAEDSS